MSLSSVSARQWTQCQRCRCGQPQIKTMARMPAAARPAAKKTTWTATKTSITWCRGASSARTASTSCWKQTTFPVWSGRRAPVAAARSNRTSNGTWKPRRCQRRRGCLWKVDTSAGSTTPLYRPGPTSSRFKPSWSALIWNFWARSFILHISFCLKQSFEDITCFSLLSIKVLLSLMSLWWTTLLVLILEANWLDSFYRLGQDLRR